MPAVETVLGPVELESLGRTLFHEHLVIRDEAVAAQFPHLNDPADLDTMIAAVADVHERGIDAVIDPTVAGLGRDVGFLRKVSEATGVHVLAGTGYFTTSELPPYFACRSPDELTDCFVRDLDVIQDTTVRAAFLKCAIDAPGLTADVEKVLRATARAHRRTGAPIMTHTRPAGCGGLVQQDVFEEEGVDLACVVIGHCGDTADLDYLERIAKRGSFFGLDRYGMSEILATEARNAVLVELWRRGFDDRLLISHDSVMLWDRRRQPHMVEQRRDWHLAYLAEEVLPVLERELGAGSVDQMLTANVGAWLGGRGAS
jgi:phosphotriesterase-related protein